MELDHIDPLSEGGTDEIENAIPVCFECHAEIHGYNDQHPRGRKFNAEELREHKAQWLRLVTERPEILLGARGSDDVGPLQALVDELEFNVGVASDRQAGVVGCQFLVSQFERALAAGSVAIVHERLKKSLLGAYRLMMRANSTIPKASTGDPFVPETGAASGAIAEAEPMISQALSLLLTFLSSERGDQKATGAGSSSDQQLQRR